MHIHVDAGDDVLAVGTVQAHHRVLLGGLQGSRVLGLLGIDHEDRGGGFTCQAFLVGALQTFHTDGVADVVGRTEPFDVVLVGLAEGACDHLQGTGHVRSVQTGAVGGQDMAAFTPHGGTGQDLPLAQPRVGGLGREVHQPFAVLADQRELTLPTPVVGVDQRHGDLVGGTSGTAFGGWFADGDVDAFHAQTCVDAAEDLRGVVPGGHLGQALVVLGLPGRGIGGGGLLRFGHRVHVPEHAAADHGQDHNDRGHRDEQPLT